MIGFLINPITWMDIIQIYLRLEKCEFQMQLPELIRSETVVSNAVTHTYY